jgi:hypothetical protein
MDKTKRKAMTQEALANLEFRKVEEAKQAVEILQRLKTLGDSAAGTK